MIENKKTEKWSSLRLDLQQFSPQEFVADCWLVTIHCDSKGFIAFSQYPKNKEISAHAHHANWSKTEKFLSEPNPSSIIQKFGSTVAYSSSYDKQQSFSNGRISGYWYEGGLLDEDHFYTLGGISTEKRVGGNNAS